MSAFRIDSPEILGEYPILAQKIALIAASWQRVEVDLGSIFTFLLGGNEGAALEIFNTLIDRHLRKQALEAVAKDRLPSVMFDKAMALFQNARRLSGRRSDVIHATWTTVPARPHSLMWVDPADISRRLHNNIKMGIHLAHSVNVGAAPDKENHDNTEITLIEYRESDFDNLLKDIAIFGATVQDLAAEVLGHVIDTAVAEQTKLMSPLALYSLALRKGWISQTNQESRPELIDKEGPPPE